MTKSKKLAHRNTRNPRTEMTITVPGRDNNDGTRTPATNFSCTVEEDPNGRKRLTSATVEIDRHDPLILVLTWDHPKHHRVAQAEVYAMCAWLELASDDPTKQWVIEAGRISNLGGGKLAAVIRIEPFRGNADEMNAIRDMLNAVVTASR